MSLDLYREEIVKDASAMPLTSQVEPGAFEGFFRGAGMAAMQGLAKTARGAAMLGAAPVVLADQAAGAIGGQPVTALSDRYFKTTADILDSAVDYWTPKPNEVGMAGQVVGQLLNILPLAIASPPLVALQTMDVGQELIKEGVSPGKAAAVATVQTAGMMAGIWMPIVGANLWQRALIGGAGFNVAQGVVTRGASEAILAGTPAGEMFKTFDLTALTLDAVIGLGFGVATHVLPAWRKQSEQAWNTMRDWAQNLTPTQMDAVLVLREAQHLNSDSLPGIPASPIDVDVHVRRMRAMIDELAGGPPANIESIKAPARDAETLLEDAAPYLPEARAALDRLNAIKEEQAALTDQLYTATEAGDAMVTARAQEAINLLATERQGIENVVAQRHGDQPVFFPDPARVAESVENARTLLEASREVRLEEGIPRVLEPGLVVPNDISTLAPDLQAQHIGQAIEDRLATTGMAPEEARANGAIWSAFFKTAGERYGIQPAALLERYGVDVRRMRSAENLVGSLEQSRPRYQMTADGPVVRAESIQITDPGIVESRGGVDIHEQEARPAEEVSPEGFADQGETFYQADKPATWYYSELARQLDAAPIKTAPAKGWTDYLKSLPQKGVKSEEIKWSGLEEWLDIQEGKVTKEQVAEFLKKGGVRVEEVMAGDKGERTPADREIVPDVDLLKKNSFFLDQDPAQPGKWGVRDDQSGDTYTAKGDADQFRESKGLEEPGDTIPDNIVDAIDRVLDHLNGGMGVSDAHTARVRDYLINHGMEAKEAEQVVNGAQVGDAQAIAQIEIMAEPADYALILDPYHRAPPTKYGSYQLPGGQNYRELKLTLPSFRPKLADFKGRPHGTYDQAVREADARGVTNFQSSHFDEPNILAHVRFNERTDADGKRVLFLEEVQSDWAKAGRTARKALVAAKAKELGITEEEAGKLVPQDAGFGPQNRFTADTTSPVDPRTGVPEAPFVGKTEAWTALALKRMIRYAAENGFDKIAWTRGEQQVERYTSALRKAVDVVEWEKTKDGIHLLGYKGREQRTSRQQMGEANYQRFLELDDIAGNRTLTGHEQDELARINGMVQRNKVVDTTEKETALSDAIGKAMADKIIKDPGQKGTIEGEDIKIDDTGMAGFYDRMLPSIAKDVMKKLGGGKVGETTIEMPARESDPDTIVRKVDGRDVADQVQPSFEITPAMREKALAGQPLFQRGGEAATPPRGAITFAEGKTIIGLFETANASTFAHETGHLWLQMTRDLATREGVPPEAAADWATLASWLKVEGGEIPREAHEQFARGWEKYLAEGVAPNEALKGVFQRFRDWLVEVYHSLTNMDVQLNDEIRGVMARMLDSQARDPSPTAAEAPGAVRPEPAPGTQPTGDTSPRPQANGPQEPTAGPPPLSGGESPGGPADMVANEASRFAAENPTVRIRVGEQNGEPVYMTPLELLDDARAEADMARQDKDLIFAAAECLLGVG